MIGQRSAVVAEALSWCGTKYHHRAAVKGVGADCAQMPLKVYADALVIPPTDVGAYSEQWHLHRSAEVYLDWVRLLAGPEVGRKPEGSMQIEGHQPGPGDFVVWKFGRTFSHGAIVIDWPRIVHAYAPARRVLLDDVTQDKDLIQRPAMIFTFWKD